MAEFPSKVSTRTSSPAQGAGTSVSALRPDLGFVRSSLGALMLLQLVSARGPAGSGAAGTGGVGAPGAAWFAPSTPSPSAPVGRDARCLSRGASGTHAPETTLEASRLETSPLQTLQAPAFGGPLSHARRALRWSLEANQRSAHRRTIAAHNGLFLSLCLCQDVAPALPGTRLE